MMVTVHRGGLLIECTITIYIQYMMVTVHRGGLLIRSKTFVIYRTTTYRDENL